MCIRTGNSMAAKSKCFGICSYSFCISALLIACLAYIYTRWVLETNQCQNLAEESKWWKYFNWYGKGNDRSVDGCDLWVWETHVTAISTSVREYREAYGYTEREAYLSLLFGILVISILAVLACLCCGRRKSELKSQVLEVSKLDPSTETELSTFNQYTQSVSREHKPSFDVKTLLLSLLVLVLIVSVPWEFVRLYQKEISKRAASVSQGAPDECKQRTISLLQSIKLFLQSQFSWSSLTQCEDYYYHVLVDPLWELTPLLVLSSAVTRCVLHPIELMFSGLGRSFRAFFVEIPAQWQPVLLVILTFVLLVVILMTCSYRLHIPLLFKIEPKTPVFYHDYIHRNANQNSPFIQGADSTNRNGSYISSPNQNSPFIQGAFSTNRNALSPNPNRPGFDSTNRNGSYTASPNPLGSNMHFNLNEIPRSSPIPIQNNKFSLFDSQIHSQPDSNTLVGSKTVTKKKHGRKKKDDNGKSIPRAKKDVEPKPSRSRTCRKTSRYEDDPDYSDDYDF